MAVVNPNNRLISLDVLRGIAVLMVIMNHIDETRLPGRPELVGIYGFLEWSLRHLGRSGVPLFFVLSGFLIGGLLFSEIDKHGTLRIGRFLLRRGMKIWPSYLVLLTALGVTGATQYIDYSSHLSIVLSIAKHVFFLQNYLGLGGNGPTWSLAVEEHFYTLLPFVLLLLLAKERAKLLPGIRLPHVVAFVMVLCLILRSARALQGPLQTDYMLSHYRFDALFFGVLLQYVWRSHREAIRSLIARYWYVILPACIACVLPTIFYSRRDPPMFTVGLTVMYIGYGGILLSAVCVKDEKWTRFKSMRCVAAIGRHSYNIYLWHYFIPKLFPSYVTFQLWLSSKIANDFFCVAVQVFVFAALSIGIGYLGTKLIETPFLKLRDRLVASKYKAV